MIDQNIIEKQREIELWDRIDDKLGLEENEVTARNKCLAELLRYAHWKENFLFQKAKVKWLLEGDVNSGFFHGWINKRRKVNEIDGLYFEGVWTESVEGVKNGVRTHFLKHFKSPNLLRPNITKSLFSRRIDKSKLGFISHKPIPSPPFPIRRSVPAHPTPPLSISRLPPPTPPPISSRLPSPPVKLKDGWVQGKLYAHQLLQNNIFLLLELTKELLDFK
ncbi:hypothetical protein ACS0TY_005992 [Phlomoides rotata]